MAKKTKKPKKVKKTKKTKKSTKKSDDEIIQVLHGSTKFKTEISLVIFRFEPKFLVRLLQAITDDIERGRVTQISQGTNVIVLLCDESLAKELEKNYKKYIVEHKKDLVAYTIMFPKKAIQTPGIISFISKRFAKNGINIIEVIGCYTDITFVLNRKDLFKAMDLLGEFIL